MSRASRLLTYEFAKRAIDVVASGLAIVVLAPVLAVVALAVATSLGPPVVFAQDRPGLNARIFRLYKFRTMKSIDETRGLVTNEQRLTRLGRVLRSSSLDELPSLWNIIRGDMSLVGPRPLRVSYLERYSDEQQGRHRVRPGLTGLAQVRGRNTVDWDERLELDLQYVEGRTLLRDLRIVLATVMIVVRREGVTEAGQATKSEFLGAHATRRLRLVPLSHDHLPVRVAWLNDPSVRAGISISFSADMDAMRSWFELAASDSTRHDWVGIDPQDESPVSMCGLREDGERNYSVYLYVDPARQHRGFGRETMQLLLTRARELGAESLTLETPRDNTGAISLYERIGFVDIGERSAGAKRAMRLEVVAGHPHG